MTDQRKHETTRIVRPNGAMLDKDKFDSAKVVKGRYRDRVYKLVDGKEVLVEETDFKSNLIVVGMPKLLAGLMANEPSFLGGIRYSAQGKGDGAWSSPPAPTFNSASLMNEYFRKVPDSITYLDSGGLPSVPVTNSILIRTTLDYAEANDSGAVYIREQGLYGGTATGSLNSGILANLIFHAPRYKDGTVKIVRFINLIF